ncbi:hypothetical protein EQG64_11140 [Streptomyces sp. S6]|nr:hypothetical protein EQG64_11140 [Streptomyces sp. S6]
MTRRMTERNREPVTPDQNPHPPTDHDRFAPRGETPMPLVDGVALHQPPASTPPPLFRPREERDGAGEGTPVTTPAPGPLLDLGPRPTGDDTGAPAPAQDAASEPDAAPAPDLGLFVGLDPAPSRTGAGGTGPGGPGPRPDLDARPGGGSSPEPTAEAAPGPDSRAKGEDAPDLDPDPRPGPGLTPGRTAPVREPGAPGAEPAPGPGGGRGPGVGGAGRTSRPAAARSVRRAPGTSSPSGVWRTGTLGGVDPAPGVRGRGRAPPDPRPRRADGPGQGRDRDRGRGPGRGQGPGAKGAPAPPHALPLRTGPQPPPHPRRHSVIAGESTAAIPVHLLFRDDDAPAYRTHRPPTTVARQATHTAPAPADRTPPRSPHPASSRPPGPPLADPPAERPGPALSGYAALLTGAAGLLGGLALLWWRGALPAAVQSAVGLAPRPYEGIGAGVWTGLALLVTAVVLALGGLGRGRVGHAWVLTLFGDYRGTVRRTGLVWVSPLLLRRRVDVRLRHWRSEPLPAVDANGTALRVVVLVVWRIKDTVRAALGIEDHEAYLSAQVESAMARVLSQLPADAFHEDAPTLRDAEAVGDALTRMLKADCEPVGVEVYSAQPTGIEYAPEVAAAMQRRRIAAIDAKHRDSVLTSVVDAVDDTVNRLTTRGIVELDDYERKALVKDLTVAFYTGRSAGGDGA